MSGQGCYLDNCFPNTDGFCVYQQKTFIGPIRWLEPVSKRSQWLGCAHTCMMGMLAVLLPPPCFSSSFSSSCFSSLAAACLNEGYELCCLLSGLVLGCVSAWLAEVPQGYSSQTSWFAGSSRATELRYLAGLFALQQPVKPATSIRFKCQCCYFIVYYQRAFLGL